MAFRIRAIAKSGAGIASSASMQQMSRTGKRRTSGLADLVP
jgi:hypothetical protein